MHHKLTAQMIAGIALLLTTTTGGHALGPSSTPLPAHTGAAPQLVFQTAPNMPSAEAWAQVDLSSWQAKTATDLMGLFRSLFIGYAEFDGARNTSIAISPSSNEQFYEVFITQDGLADDSVAAVRWAAMVKPGPEGWILEGLWRQQRCSRGANQDLWTKNICP